MTISSTVTFRDYTANGSTSQFAFPNKIFAASDLVVTLTDPLGNQYAFTNFANSTTGLSYTVQNVDVDTGCTVVFSAVVTTGWNVDIRSFTPDVQSTSVKNQGAFLPELHEEFFDRITREVQDLRRRSYTFGIHGPDTETVVWPSLPGPIARRGLAQMYDATTGLPVLGVPTTQTLTQGLLGTIANPISPAEISAGVTPTQMIYPYGCPRRFGNANTGNGTQDDTAAVQAAINSCDTYMGWVGDIYGVTSVTFPLNGPHHINFNGSWIRGIATTATNAIVVLAMDRTTIIDYRVDGNFSQFYLCGTQWYNASASSQYNAVLGMSHRSLGGIQTASGTTVRALIYGALVGQSSTGFAQSENQVYGWRTYGCQNPFYANQNNGVIQFTDPIFVCVAEGWPGGPISPSAPWSYANGRAFECVHSIVNVKGGEIQIATAGTTFAAEMTSGCFFQDSIIETDCPIRINGDGVRFSGGRYLQDQLQPCFTMAAGCTGVFACSDMYFTRPANTGSFDNNPLIDASAVTGTFEVILSDTESYEYRWTCLVADVRLVKPGVATTVRYKNHRMSMTAVDPNVYVLNTNPTDSLLDITAFDRLGYTTNGWQLTQDFGGGTTLSVTTSAGPAGYLASQIQLLAPSGQQAIATYGNPTSLSTLKTSAVFVHPGDLYWVSAWCNEVTGTGGKLSARFFTLTGAVVSDVPIADSGSIPSGAWKYMESPLAVPATAAYMCVGLMANNGTIALTDLRLRRAA